MSAYRCSSRGLLVGGYISLPVSSLCRYITKYISPQAPPSPPLPLLPPPTMTTSTYYRLYRRYWGEGGGCTNWDTTKRATSQHRIPSANASFL